MRHKILEIIDLTHNTVSHINFDSILKKGLSNNLNYAFNFKTLKIKIIYGNITLFPDKNI